jgi:hypothetical protein
MDLDKLNHLDMSLRGVEEWVGSNVTVVSKQTPAHQLGAHKDGIRL